MNDPVHKRTTKIFLLMSDFISTKNPSQCRSHHQKFFAKLNAEAGDEDSASLRETLEDTIESLQRTSSCQEDWELPWEEERPMDNFLLPDEDFLSFEDDFPFHHGGFQAQPDFFAEDSKHTFLF